MQVQRTDFDASLHTIVPGADPTAISQTEKLLKAQGLLELLPIVPGMLNPVEVINRVLEAQEQPNREALFSPEIAQSGQYQPPPDPKMAQMQVQMQLKDRELQQKGLAQQQDMELKARGKQVELAMEQQQHAQDMEHQQQMNVLQRADALAKQRIFEVQSAQNIQQSESNHQQQLIHGEQDHQQKLKRDGEQSEAKVQAMKKQAAAKPAKKSSKGSKKK
jgi:hypothetical protein